jgi:hypothetical protein
MSDKGDLFRGTQPRVFTTNPEEPASGRVFVWAWTQWFERVEGSSGAIAFTPAARSEQELREQYPEESSFDLTELDDEFAGVVRGEFLEQSPLYPEAPELSHEMESPEEGEPPPGGGAHEEGI